MGREIKSVAAHIADVQLKVPVETAHGRFTHQRSVVVRVNLDDGAEGWGAVDPVAGFSVLSPDAVAENINGLARPLRGLRIGDRAALSTLLGTLRSGRQAVEMALADAEARAEGKSFGAFIGVPQRREIPLAGWIGWGTPGEAAGQAADWQRRGFAGLKLKIGSGIDVDLARVSAVREAVGPEMHLIVDAGEAYGADDAIALLRKMQPFGVAACEQPVPQHDLRALAEIRNRTGVPLILDESVRTVADLHRVVAEKAVDIIKLKLVKHDDGLDAALVLGRAAAELGIQCTVGHGFALGLATLAEAHIASVLTNFYGPGEMVGPLKMLSDVVRPALDLASGRLLLSNRPGLGVDVDVAMLDAARTEVPSSVPRAV